MRADRLVVRVAISDLAAQQLLHNMQVRSLRAVSDYKLLQALPSPAAHTAVSPSQGTDGCVFAVSGAEVWQLRPTPLLEQVCLEIAGNVTRRHSQLAM